MTSYRTVAARAAALRPNTLGGGTLETFQAMARGRPVYESRDYTSSPPDYSEALRRYNRALGLLSEEE